MAHKVLNNFELYYNTLLTIFPEISPEHIAEVCLNPPFDTTNPRSEDDCLHSFIDYLCGYSDILEESRRLEHLRLDKATSANARRNKRVETAPRECQCCYDEFDSSAVRVKCQKNHAFCRFCVIKGTDLAISNGESSVKCFMGCGEKIGLPALRRVLPSRTLEVLAKKRQEAEIAAARLNNLECCPFCPYQMEIDPGLETFYCQNPECMKVTCRLCKKKYHYETKCEDVLDEHKARLLVEEEMSRALIRSCYRYNKPFVIRDGCNKIKCSCGAIMCYKCRKPISGYGHFNNRPRGCSLYENWVRMDGIQVDRKRDETISKIRRDFPDLKIPKV